MPTKAQIDKLHARIDAIEDTLRPRIEGCVIEYPPHWDMDRVFEHHCKTFPEDAYAKIAVFVPLLEAEPPPPGKEHLVSKLRDFDALLAEHHKPAELGGNGWRSWDYDSWRELARAEIAAGRDPNVTLRQG